MKIVFKVLDTETYLDMYPAHGRMDTGKQPPLPPANSDGATKAMVSMPKLERSVTVGVTSVIPVSDSGVGVVGVRSNLLCLSIVLTLL